jgi:hypothetical protein
MRIPFPSIDTQSSVYRSAMSNFDGSLVAARILRTTAASGASLGAAGFLFGAALRAVFFRAVEAALFLRAVFLPEDALFVPGALFRVAFLRVAFFFVAFLRVVFLRVAMAPLPLLNPW